MVVMPLMYMRIGVARQKYWGILLKMQSGKKVKNLVDI